MSKFQPCLGFNTEAEEAAKFYTSIFKNSKMGSGLRMGPKNSVVCAPFELEGVSFLALNIGPQCKPNPSISFTIGCDSREELDMFWSKLNKKTRMPLQEYPYSKYYGWCEDQYGVNWQLIIEKQKQKITPAFLFTKKNVGKCEEAMNFYIKQFPNSKIVEMHKDEKTGNVMHAVFSLDGEHFMGMESEAHTFEFDYGVSMIAACKDQAEIDRLNERMSAVPEAVQCSWLKDKYGMSWQIVLKDWINMMASADKATSDRMMAAVMKMKKFDVNAAMAAAKG